MYNNQELQTRTRDIEEKYVVMIDLKLYLVMIDMILKATHASFSQLRTDHPFRSI